MNIAKTEQQVFIEAKTSGVMGKRAFHTMS